MPSLMQQEFGRILPVFDRSRKLLLGLTSIHNMNVCDGLGPKAFVASSDKFARFVDCNCAEETTRMSDVVKLTTSGPKHAHAESMSVDFKTSIFQTLQAMYHSRKTLTYESSQTVAELSRRKFPPTS
jgi:hypothetical protein